MLIQVFLSGVPDYAKQVTVNIHFKNPIFHPNKQDTNRLEFCPARVSIFQLSSLDLSVGWTMDCQALLCHRVINQLMHIYCLLLEKKIENDNVKPTYVFFTRVFRQGSNTSKYFLNFPFKFSSYAPS